MIISPFSTFDLVMPALGQNQVMINEVELNPAGSDSSGNEAVELYNPTDNAIDICGWHVSSTAGKTSTATLPHGTVIPARGFFVVRMQSQQWLDNSREGIILTTANGITIDKVGPFSDNDNDAKTWQRTPDGSSNWTFKNNTLGGSNGNLSNNNTQASTTNNTILPPSMPSRSTSEPLQIKQDNNNSEASFSSAHQIDNNKNNSNLKIVFIDVGQGDSTLIILPNGKTMLIDGGERDKGDTVLSTIAEMNVKRIDAIVATHPHSDHIGGLIAVMNQIPVGHVYDSGQDYSTSTYLDYLNAIVDHKIPFTSVHDGDTLSLDPQVKSEVLNPPNPLISGSDDDISNNSVVLRLTYGNFSVVFPGDVKEAGEQRLATNKNMDANVLLAAHHGSKHANSISFLKAITPQTVVIYAGKNNQYGFPNQEALNNFKTMQVKNIFRTDQDGSIILTADGSLQYTMQTLTSKKTVVVPEFGIGSASTTTILIYSIAVIAIVIFSSRMVKLFQYGRN